MQPLKTIPRPSSLSIIGCCEFGERSRMLKTPMAECETVLNEKPAGIGTAGVQGLRHFGKCERVWFTFEPNLTAYPAHNPRLTVPRLLTSFVVGRSRAASGVP